MPAKPDKSRLGEPPPGMLPDGKLNTVEQGSPRKPPEVIEENDADADNEP